jgi:hypothetical protein
MGAISHGTILGLKKTINIVECLIHILWNNQNYS